MDFLFETTYDQKSMTVMARVLRKTVRKKHSRFTHIFGWFMVAFCIGMMFFAEGGFSLSSQTVITLLAVIAITVTLIFEDQLNGYTGRKRLPPGVSCATTIFSEDGYHSSVDLGESNWNYDKVYQLAETEDYFVFIFSQSHGQVYDKKSLKGGSLEEFKTFIEEKTGKTFVFVK